MDAIPPFRAGEGLEQTLARVAGAQHGVFTRRQARDLGATDSHLKHQVRRGRYRRLYRGVFALGGAAPSYQQGVLAVCLAGGGPAYASHRTAAWIWSMPVTPDQIEVTTRIHRRNLEGIRIYRTNDLPAADVTITDGIPITTPTRTLIDLAAVVDEEPLEIALDDALRRRLTSIPRLTWRLRELAKNGRHGTAAMRALLAQRATGRAPESPLETQVIRAIRNAGLPTPQRQYSIRCGSQLTARLDLAWPSHRVAVEVDSYRFHSGRVEWERDLARRNALEALGWTVLHVTARQLKTGEFVRQLGVLLRVQTSFFGPE